MTRSIADERQQKSHIDHSKAPENPATCQFLPYKHHSPIAWAGTDQKQEKVEVIPKHRAIMNVGMGASAAHVGNSQSAAPLLSHTEDRLREIDQNPINDATQPRARPNQQSETLQTVDIGPEALPAVDMVWKLSNLDYMPRPIKVVRVGDEGFPREAQDKYQRFMDYRRQMCEIEPNVKSLFSKKVIRRVLLPSREGSAEPVPYILIKGCNKTEVTKLHTELSRRVWRREYHPPLKICYQLGSLLFPASQKEVFFAEDQERVTLCGALVSIADGKENRTVTLGGILESNRRLFAFTAGHSSSTASELEEEGSFTGQHTKEQDGNFEATVTIPQAQDYDDDIEDALVFLHAEELDNDVEDASVTPHAKAYKKSSSTTSTEWSKTPTIGHVDISGQDWSLVALNDPLLALPNIFNNVESGLTQCYLHEVAQQPGKCVVVLAGASGQKKMKMISGEAEICLPSGEWVVTWELEMDVNSRKYILISHLQDYTY